MVNGRTWPSLTVQRRRYRFRLLNGCNSRFLLLSVAAHATARPARPVLPVWQIGSDGGFLPEPVPHERVTLGPAQRVDAIVDFTDVPVGTELYLVNEGPDWAYGGGRPGVDFEPADPHTTGQVLRFVVTDATGADPSVPPEQLRLPSHTPARPGPAGPPVVAERAESVPGGLDDHAARHPRRAGPGPAAALERPGDRAAHPRRHRGVGGAQLHRGTCIRSTCTRSSSSCSAGDTRAGRCRARGTGGGMDTVLAYPWEVTRIKAHFDLPGRYAWHCHLLEHEDNEMMRPLNVLPRGGAAAGDGGSPSGAVEPATASTDAG